MNNFHPYYLYFFDRELLTTCGLYGLIKQRSLFNDTILSIFTTPHSVYYSSSLSFESEYANKFFWQYQELFQKGIIFLTISGAQDLYSWILKKRDQYSKDDKERYKKYFNDEWKRMVASAPIINFKLDDTTSTLHKTLINRFLKKEFGNISSAIGAKEVISKHMEKLTPRLIDSIQNRKGRAITKKLFESTYRKTKANQYLQRAFNMIISIHYVNAQMKEYKATIPINGHIPIHEFDNLGINYPLNDLQVWQNIYQVLGIYDDLMMLSSSEIVTLKNNEYFLKSIKKIKDFILNIDISANLPLKLPSLKLSDNRIKLSKIIDTLKNLANIDWPYNLFSKEKEKKKMTSLKNKRKHSNYAQMWEIDPNFSEGSLSKREHEEEIDLRKEDFVYTLLEIEISYINKKLKVIFKLLDKNKRIKTEEEIKEFERSERGFAFLFRLAVAKLVNEKEGWLYKYNDLYIEPPRDRELGEFRNKLGNCKITFLEQIAKDNNIDPKELKKSLIRTRKYPSGLRLAIANIDINKRSIENLKHFKCRIIPAKKLIELSKDTVQKIRGKNLPTQKELIQIPVVEVVETLIHNACNVYESYFNSIRPNQKI